MKHRPNNIHNEYTGYDYDIIAWFHHEKMIGDLRKIGSYDGEWFMVTYKQSTEEYKVYSDYYGSCGGCDAYESTFGWNCKMKRTNPVVRKFVERYKPFSTTHKKVMKKLIDDGDALTIFPFNTGGYWSGNTSEVYEYYLEEIKKHIEE